MSLMKTVSYSNYQSYIESMHNIVKLRVRTRTLDFDDEFFNVEMIFVSHKLRKRVFKPCLGIESLQSSYFNMYIEDKRKDGKNLLAIYGRNLCHMVNPSLLLSNIIKIRLSKL